MRPEFHPAAAEELTAAAQIYEKQAAALGAELNAEVKRLTQLLCSTPHIGERLDSRHRRFPLQRFPFGLIFRDNGEILQIIAVAHRRRRPSYWRTRR